MSEDPEELKLLPVELLPDREKVLPMMGGNQQLLQDVLKLLISEATKLSNNFLSAVEKNDCQSARRAVHTLKSNVSQFGLENFASVAGRIEVAAIEEQIEFLENAKPTVIELAARTRTWANGILAEL